MCTATFNFADEVLDTLFNLRQQYADSDNTVIENIINATTTARGLTNTSDFRRRALAKTVLTVTAYYVGQGFQSFIVAKHKIGDCTLIEYEEVLQSGATKKANALIDFGSKGGYYPPSSGGVDEDVCKILQAKFLQQNGGYKVDWLFLTHPDGVFCSILLL